jgi:FkbM family methyltransferase
MLAKNFDLVRAFEPNPEAVVILKRKIAKSRLLNIQIDSVALSDSVGVSRLYLPTAVREATIGSSNSLIPPSQVDGQGSDGRQNNTMRSVEVKTDTVDNLIANERIDLMKVDVEGAEFMVLSGAKHTLNEGRITNLMIELHNVERKDELDSLLASHHYQTRWLDYTPAANVSRVFAALSP